MDVDAELRARMPLIRRVAQAFVRRTGWIEFDDAVQVTSLAAWKVIGDRERYSDVEGAIVTIAWRRLTDELRSGRVTGLKRRDYENGARIPTLVSFNMRARDEEAAELGEIFGSVSDDYDAIGLDDAVAQAMSRLPERERFIVWCVYFADLTNVEISEMLDVSEGRVSQLLKKARCRMTPALAAAA